MIEYELLLVHKVQLVDQSCSIVTAIDPNLMQNTSCFEFLLDSNFSKLRMAPLVLVLLRYCYCYQKYQGYVEGRGRRQKLRCG